MVNIIINSIIFSVKYLVDKDAYNQNIDLFVSVHSAQCGLVHLIPLSPLNTFLVPRANAYAKN